MKRVISLFVILVLMLSLVGCNTSEKKGKMGYIKENPIEEVEKPEKNHFVGKFYQASELNKIIEITKGTKLELPVIFGGVYGLRRSEIVGLRWSSIDL